MASSMRPSTPAASLRMCVAYRRPRRPAGATIAATSSAARVEPGLVDQAARDAGRARVERLLDVADHRRELVGVRAPGPRPEHRAANRPVPDQEGDVDPERLRLHRVHEPAERRPGRVQLEGGEVGIEHRPGRRRQRRERVAAVARQLGRVALAQGLTERRRRTGTRRSARAGPRTRERRRGPSRRWTLGHVGVCDGGQVPDRGDAVARNGDVGATARRPVPSTSVPPRISRSKAIDSDRTGGESPETLARTSTFRSGR